MHFEQNKHTFVFWRLDHCHSTCMIEYLLVEVIPKWIKNSKGCESCYKQLCYQFLLKTERLRKPIKLFCKQACTCKLKPFKLSRHFKWLEVISLSLGINLLKKSDSWTWVMHGDSMVMHRPGKIVYFLASKSEFPSSLTLFPSSTCTSCIFISYFVNFFFQSKSQFPGKELPDLSIFPDLGYASKI